MGAATVFRVAFAEIGISSTRLLGSCWTLRWLVCPTIAALIVSYLEAPKRFLWQGATSFRVSGVIASCAFAASPRPNGLVTSRFSSAVFGATSRAPFALGAVGALAPCGTEVPLGEARAPAIG